jgi:hypothetical protein
MPTKGILRGSPTPPRVAAQALPAQRHARLALKHPVSWTSSGMSVLGEPRLNHRPEVVGGLLEQECGELLSEFFASRRGRVI